MKVKAKVRGLGDVYVNGLERLEIHVAMNDGEGLPYKYGTKVPVKLTIGSQKYDGWLRATEASYVWISPTLYDKSNVRTTLAEMFKKEGIQKNQPLTLDVSGKNIKVTIA
jgi:hypothetical protein